MDAPALPLVRRLRIAGIALVVAWFLVPGLRDWIPVWVPFLAFAALELNYLAGGLRDRGSPRRSRGRSPQESDISELGGEEWLEPALVRIEGHDVWLPVGGRSDEEVHELIEESRARLLRGEPALEPEPLPAPREVRGGGRRLLARLEGLAVVGVLAFVLFVLLPDRGWDGLDESEQRADRGAALGRGGPDRRDTRPSFAATRRARPSGSSSTPTAWPRSAAPAPS